MSGGDNLHSMIENFKDKFKDIKVNIMGILTPIYYLEYCLKLFLILDKKRLKIVQIVYSSFNILLLVLSILVKTKVRTVSILLALILGFLLIEVLIMRRNAITKIATSKKRFKNHDDKIITKKLDVKFTEIPEQLNKYKEENR